MPSINEFLSREWERFRDSFDADTVIESCRPAAAVIPVVFWVTANLTFKYVPSVNRLIGLQEIALPIAASVLAGSTSILSWAFGRRRRGLLAALQLMENGFYTAAFVSTAVWSRSPASYVICGLFALSCIYWGISFSFTIIGFSSLFIGSAPFLLVTGVDPIETMIVGIGFLFFFSMGNLTRHRRSHATHALRSEDVLNRLEMLVGSCRSGVVAEMGIKVATLAHRVRGCLHTAADDVREIGGAKGDPEARSAISSILVNLERSVLMLDDFLDGLRSGAETSPAFHLPKIAACVETSDPGDEERLVWGSLPDVWVSGQESMIALSLQSLIDNAIEAGARCVRLDTEKIGGEIVVTIADDGPGLPPKVRNNLFRPYNTFGKSRGVGLGIYLAAQILRAAGGDLELVASSARGTRFRATLPINEPFREERLDTQRRLQALKLGGE
jgi:signal transduction histidine kinase